MIIPAQIYIFFPLVKYGLKHLTWKLRSVGDCKSRTERHTRPLTSERGDWSLGYHKQAFLQDEGHTS